MPQPLIILHRVNTIGELEHIKPKFGVEIDIRHDNRTGGLYLNHDPGTGDDFDEYMKQFAGQGNRFIVLNIKETGIEQRVIDTAKRLGVEDYFLLDVEFPFIYRAVSGKVHDVDRRIAVRYSEAEPVEQALFLKGKLEWVWVDTNTKLPLDTSVCKKLSSFKLALVGPDRWGRPEDIPLYIKKMKKDGVQVDTVLTKEQYAEQWENSGILRNFVSRKK